MGDGLWVSSVPLSPIAYSLFPPAQPVKEDANVKR